MVNTQKHKANTTILISLILRSLQEAPLRYAEGLLIC